MKKFSGAVILLFILSLSVAAVWQHCFCQDQDIVLVPPPTLEAIEIPSNIFEFPETVTNPDIKSFLGSLDQVNCLPSAAKNTKQMLGNRGFVYIPPELLSHDRFKSELFGPSKKMAIKVKGANKILGHWEQYSHNVNMPTLIIIYLENSLPHNQNYIMFRTDIPKTHRPKPK